MQQPVKFLLENLDMRSNVIHGAYQADIKKLLLLHVSAQPRDALNPSIGKKENPPIIMIDVKREIIRQLLNEYDIGAGDSRGLKDLLGGTIKEMM